MERHRWGEEAREGRGAPDTQTQRETSGEPKGVRQNRKWQVGEGEGWCHGTRLEVLGGIRKQLTGECGSQLGGGEESSEACSGAQGSSQDGAQGAPGKGEQRPHFPLFLGAPAGAASVHPLGSQTPVSSRKGTLFRPRRAPEPAVPVDAWGRVHSEWPLLPTPLAWGQRWPGACGRGPVDTGRGSWEQEWPGCQGGSTSTLLGPITCPL